MLPILADELLANSDSSRAEAIIDALTEISRDGRQIFYFTAQEDEVMKWKAYLAEDEEIEVNVHILSKDGKSFREKLVEADPASRVQIFKEIPEPKSHSHHEYGNLLNVPKVNLLRDSVGSLHIWYLVEDPNLLYHILQAGPERWGMLKNFLDEEGVIEGLNDQSREKIRNKAALFEKYVELYRQGRPRPIDRSVLEEADAVTDTKIDEVAELLAKVGGNPQRLLDKLWEGAVSRFYDNKKEELEAYLIEGGYLDNSEPMDDDAITTALQAFISNLSLSKKEAQDFLNQF
jgi:hypothetical protein